MKKEQLDQIAQKLWDAENGVYQFPKFSEDYPDMTVEDAYNIQLNIIRKKYDRGEKLVGMKIGLTSSGMQNLLGVFTPDYGHLTDRMLVIEGQPCRIDELIQPKVEGELAFVLDKDLAGPSVTVADVFNATSYIVPAIEIVDSRLTDWDINYFDTVADNGSSARFVAGSRMLRPENVDMRTTGMVMERNGSLVSSGAAAEVWGNPAAAVAWLANSICEFGISLKAGQIILAGAFTAAVEAKKGDNFNITFGSGLGSVGVRFE